MSVVLPAAEASPPLPLRVGLACAEGIEAALGVHTTPLVRVKWPNDLLVHDRKVGGVLCEAGPHGVVVGIGINVRTPEEGFDPSIVGSATTLEVEIDKSLERIEIAGCVLRRVLRQVDDVRGWAGARSAFLGRDALLGRSIVTESEGPGVARGVDADGALVLERPDGSSTLVTSGSVRLAADAPRPHHASADGPDVRDRPNRGE